MDSNISKELPNLIFGDFIVKVEESKLFMQKPVFFIDENIYRSKNVNVDEVWEGRKYRKKYYCSEKYYCSSDEDSTDFSDSYESD